MLFISVKITGLTHICLLSFLNSHEITKKSQNKQTKMHYVHKEPERNHSSLSERGESVANWKL